MPRVEQFCLKTSAELGQLEKSWESIMAARDPEGVALMLRLLLTHMTDTSKRLLSATVLDRLDAEEKALFEGLTHKDIQSPAEA